MSYRSMPKEDKLLARYFEKKGWWWEAYGNGGGYWHREPHKQKYKGDQCKCNSRNLPRIDTDANAAIAEANSTFQNRWMIKRDPLGFVFSLHGTRVAYATGKSFCYAILSALIRRVEIG